MKIQTLAKIIIIVCVIVIIAAAISMKTVEKRPETTTILTTTMTLTETATAEVFTISAETETTAETTTKETSTKDIEQGEHTTPLGRFHITGYTAEEGFGYGSETASGVGCRPGICAMNNQQRKELGIEYGDTIYIKDLGSYQVQDCGCGYGVVDIWMNTNAQAYAITGYYEVYI